MSVRRCGHGLLSLYCSRSPDGRVLTRTVMRRYAGWSMRVLGSVMF